MIVMFLVIIVIFDLENRQRGRMDLDLDLAPRAIGAPDFIAAVVDLDAAHDPAVVARQLFERVARLPVGHQGETVIIGQSHRGRCGHQQGKQGEGLSHGPNSRLRPEHPFHARQSLRKAEGDGPFASDLRQIGS